MMQDELEKFIGNNRDEFDKQSPEPEVLNRILKQMQAKGIEKPKGIVIPFRVMQWAAACVFLMACGIAYWTLHKQPEVVTVVKVKEKPQAVKKNGDDSVAGNKVEEISKNEPVKHKNMDAIDKELAKRKEVLAANFKEHNTNAKKKLVMFAGLNNTESPATRIAATTEVYHLKSVDRDVVDALAETLNSDPNSNVRLAALDGLAQFDHDDYVGKKVSALLKKQQAP